MISLYKFIDDEEKDFTKLNDIIIDRGLDNVNDLTEYNYEYSIKDNRWYMTARSEEIYCLWVFDNDHECIDFIVIADWTGEEPEEEEENPWALTEEEEIAYNKYDDERGAWELWEQANAYSLFLSLTLYHVKAQK